MLERTFAAEVRAAIENYPEGRQASAVIRLLFLAQAAYGRITDEAIEEVATLLDMEPTHVRGVVGFYSLLKDEPHGKFVVHYCTDLPCMLRGAGDLLPKLCDAVGARPGEVSADGMFSVEEAMCLAECDRAPMMQVNLEYYTDLTPERIDEIVARLRSKAAAGPPPRAPYGYGPPSEIGAVEGGHVEVGDGGGGDGAAPTRQPAGPATTGEDG